MISEWARPHSSSRYKHAESARERGIRPICELLGAVTANSAFHGTRLDVNHIGDMMEYLIRRRGPLGNPSRRDRAEDGLRVARDLHPGAADAAAEVYALRRVFGDRADDIVVANTEGIHRPSDGSRIQDVVAVKVLETGIVAGSANFKEIRSGNSERSTSRRAAPTRSNTRCASARVSARSIACCFSGW